MNVVFVSIFRKTQPLHEMARGMQALDIDISWVSPSLRWRDWLAEKGWPNVERLDYRRTRTLSSTDHHALEEIGHLLGVPPFQVCVSDRLLSQRATVESLSHVADVFLRGREFFSRIEARFLIVEPTSGFDLALVAAIRSVGGQAVHPHTVRYPAGRTGVFLAPEQSELLRLPESTVEEDRHCKEPDFVRLAKNPTRFDHQWPSLFASKMSDLLTERGGDPTLATLGEFFGHRNPLTRLARAKRNAMFLANAGIARDELRETHVLFTMHRQPEQAIDWLAWRHQDQTALIAEIAQSLPDGLRLAVKEHPVGLGDRHPELLRSLSRIPRVDLVSGSVTRDAIFQRVRAVVSPTGTISYEAGLGGVPAGIVRTMFFSSLESVVTLETNEAISDWIGRLLTVERHEGGGSGDQFLNTISSLSRSVELYDPTHFPSTMRPENVSRLREFGRDVGEALRSPVWLTPGDLN